jgi:hypothetical protein
MFFSKKIYYVSNRKILTLLLAFALLVLLIPLIINSFHDMNIITNNPSLYHIRIAEDIIEGDFLGGTDELTYFKRPMYVSFFHYFLSGSIWFLGRTFTLIVFPILMGLFSIIALYLLLERLQVDKKILVLTISLLIASPVFVFTFSTLNAYAFIATFLLWGLYFYSRDELWGLITSLVLFVLVSFFSRFSIILLLAFLLSYSLITSKKQKWFLVVLFTLLLVGFKFVPQMFFEFDTIQETNALVDFVSDFGGVVGFSIFALVLGTIGLFTSWAQKKQKYPLYLLLLILIYMAIDVNKSFNIYLLFLVSYLAAIGLLRILKIKWHFTVLRDLTLIIIMCGLIFSTVSYYDRLAQNDYSDEVAVLNWLSTNTREDSSVLSHYQNGFLIQTLGKRRAVLDPLSAYNIGFDQTNDEMNQIFDSRNLRDTKALLKKYKVDYIFINEQMRHGGVWDEDDQGLLFLLQNNETFKKVHSVSGVNLYKVIIRPKI